MPTRLPHIIVWGVRHDRSVGIDIPVYPSGLEESLYERGVAWAGKQRNQWRHRLIGQGYHPFKVEITGSSPVAATNWLYE